MFRALFLIVLASVSVSGRSQASLLAEETFNYAVGSKLDDGVNPAAGGFGFAAAWDDPVAGTAFPENLDYIANQIPLAPGFSTLDVRGNSLQVTNPTGGTGEVTRALTTIPATNGTFLWFAFLLRKDGETVGTDDTFTLTLQGSTGFGLVIGDLANTANFGIRRTGTTTGQQNSTVAVPEDVTTFVVGRISFLAGNDSIDLFLNPAPGTVAPTTPATAQPFTNIDLGNISTLKLFANNGIDWSVDEIRLGTEYRDVAPVPEPSALTLVMAAGAAACGFRPSRRT